MTELEQRVERLEDRMRDLVVVVAGLLVSEAGSTTVSQRRPLTAALKAYVEDASDVNYRRVLEELDGVLEAAGRGD